MPAVKLADAVVPISGDNNPLRRTLESTKGLLRGFVSNVAQGIGQGVGQAIFGSINKAITGGLTLIKTSIKATSDLNESLSKTGVAFGDSSKEILAWSKTSATALGQSRQQALEAASSFGLLFSSMGLASDESADMSKRLVELATDIASINNINIDEALIKLRAGLVGETEPLRTVGVLLNAVAVEQEALRSGLASTKDAITEQDKVMARYNLILRQTEKTQGDFARTSQGIANQERILAAQREDALARIGAAFSPIYLVILNNINRLLGQIAPYGENIVRRLAEGMVNGIIFLLPAVKAIKDFITYWLKPGSPPRILPDLVKWGASAMNEYLGGWTKADFGILENLGGTIESIIRSFVTSGKIGEGNVVEAVFGTRQAIQSAIAQWRTAGRVTEDSIRSIQAAAGPAGESLAGLVRAYFDMEGASRRAAQAQRELTDVTDTYDRLLRPLNRQLDEINDKQQAIRDRQATSAARKVLRNPSSTANEKRLASLEIEEIAIRQQIDSVGEERDLALEAAQEKLRAAQKEVEVSQAVYQAQAALLDQQVTINRLIGEERELRKKQADDAERLYQAALQYDLAIASNEGKLALLRLELGRYTKGSEEYYGILTQIHSVEEAIKAEAAAGESLVPGSSILPDLSDLDIPKWAEELSSRLDTAIKNTLGLKNPVMPALMGPKEEGFPSLASFSQEAIPDETVSERIISLVDSLKSLSSTGKDLNETLGKMLPLFTTLADAVEFFTGLFKDDTEESLDTVEKDWNLFGDFLIPFATKLFQLILFIFGNMWKSFQLIGEAGLLLWQGRWGEAWEKIKEVGVTKWRLFMGILESLFGETDRLFTTWAEGVQDMIAAWDLGEAGRAWIMSLWTGMKNYWDTVVKPWWDSTALGKMVDMLPGSEPKDASSPLAGLPARGKAIIENLQMGIDASKLVIPESSVSLMAKGAEATRATGGRSITVAQGAFQFNGVTGAEGAISSLEEALDKFLEELANA